MSRWKKYLDIDVVEAARRRIHHIYDTFDSVAVMFSGGKDSMAALHMTKMVADERGIKKINAVFRDEEVIPDVVIDTIKRYRAKEWVNLLYFAYPLKSTMFVLGEIREYVQWDASGTREWVRPKPDFAIVPPHGDTRVFDQYTMDAEIAKYFKGKVAFITGIRAAESLMRYRSVVNKLNENYICASSVPNVKLCKPIYDWEENDLFKFFHERCIEYCSLYDSQLWAGQPLRVATPLIPERAKFLDKLRATAPELYQRVVAIFPEMTVQERYYKELDREALVEKYGQSFDGVRAWIYDHIDDEAMLKRALGRLNEVIIGERNQPGSYPVKAVLNWFVSGTFKRTRLMPQRNKA